MIVFHILGTWLFLHIKMVGFTAAAYQMNIDYIKCELMELTRKSSELILQDTFSFQGDNIIRIQNPTSTYVCGIFIILKLYRSHQALN